MRGRRRKLTAAALVCCLALSVGAAQATPQADGWLTGAIFEGGVTVPAGSTAPMVGGWVHIEAGGNVVALKRVSASGFKIRLPEGEYRVFASLTQTQSQSHFVCARRVHIEPQRLTAVKLWIGCYAE